MAKPLGRLEPVDLREQWPDEARDFTAWLADEGLALLGETLGADLILVRREAGVGPFNADILAQIDGEDEHLVVIENQLERTNHDHLGKLITYAAGLGARTVVWVTSEFTEQHRQALDWLNSLQGDVSFFGLQVELVRICNSLSAPQFRVVSSPNTWTKAVRQTEQAELTETKVHQQEFWQELADYMRAKGTFLSLKTPRPQHWYEIALGRTHFHISLTINSRLRRVGCEVYLGGSQAKQAFDLLHSQKVQIESELALPLEWRRLENRKASRIVVFHDGSIGDTAQRDDVKEWMRATAEHFHRVFSPKIVALELGPDNEEDQ